MITSLFLIGVACGFDTADDPPVLNLRDQPVTLNDLSGGSYHGQIVESARQAVTAAKHTERTEPFEPPCCRHDARPGGLHAARDGAVHPVTEVVYPALQVANALQRTAEAWAISGLLEPCLGQLEPGEAAKP